MEEKTGGERRFRQEQRDFDALFRDHYAEIVRYLTARLGSREEADDLAAEVFLEALQRLPRLRWRGRPVLAWLYRVAANMAADALKRRAKVGTMPETAHEAGHDESERVAEREALSRALATLPPEHQLVIHLRLVEGYPFAEVARLTGRSVGSCHMLVLRSARRLREQLQKEGIRAPA